MLRVPGPVWKGCKAEDCLIKVVELFTFGSCLIHTRNHLLEAVPVIPTLNLNRRLSAPNALEADLELAIDPADESG